MLFYAEDLERKNGPRGSKDTEETMQFSYLFHQAAARFNRFPCLFVILFF